MSEADDGARGRKGESVLSLVPRLAKLAYHLARDPRVPWTVKAALAGLAAYLACPIDIIPDWIPVLGYLDDVLVAGLVVSFVLRSVPSDVVREHWGEDVHVLESLRRRRKKKE